MLTEINLAVNCKVQKRSVCKRQLDRQLKYLYSICNPWIEIFTIVSKNTDFDLIKRKI